MKRKGNKKKKKAEPIKKPKNSDAATHVTLADLPLEIVEEILSRLPRNDHKKMKEYRFINRITSNYFQRILFEKVILNSRRHVYFLGFICGTPQGRIVAKHVKELIITDSIPEEDRFSEEMWWPLVTNPLSELISIMENLEKFTMRANPIYDCLITSEILMAISKSKIKKLDLSEVSFCWDHRDDCNRILPREKGNLEWEECAGNAEFPRLGIEILTLSPFGYIDDYICELMEACKDTLIELTLGGKLSDLRVIHKAPNMTQLKKLNACDLSPYLLCQSILWKCTNLEYLDASVDDYLDDGPPTEVYDVLNNNIGLKTLIIKIDTDNELESKNYILYSFQSISNNGKGSWNAYRKV